MNFTSTIKAETDKKYKKMLDSTSEAPFSATPEISSQSTYSGKRDKYYGRLNKEKSDFNNALQQVKNNRDRRLRNEQDNVLASLVLVFCIGLAATNLYFVAQSSNSYKVTFWGGDNSQIEYIEKGDSITLPSSTKANVDHDTYVTKYTFDGWLIDGDLYRAGQKYEPTANTSIEAKFTATDWATVTIYRSNASITLSYDGKSTSPSNGDKIEIKVGTSIEGCR